MKIVGLQQHALKPHMLDFNYFLMIIAKDRADHQRVIVVFLTEVYKKTGSEITVSVSEVQDFSWNLTALVIISKNIDYFSWSICYFLWEKNLHTLCKHFFITVTMNEFHKSKWGCHYLFSALISGTNRRLTGWEGEQFFNSFTESRLLLQHENPDSNIKITLTKYAVYE